VLACGRPRSEGVRASRVFLKSLTLRGFKSFAEKTTLDFEPGVTVIVGPNGSGKSNVVDAIAWVLGEQGPKSLRGGKMEDVIFAGTGSRAALGRAEVALSIDNSAGLLPIDYSEVTVTRLLYRSGESEYALNGTPCRLLDIQELLSDTGVGRELHTVLGQNRLEDVLQGRPEDRRAAIEEAAGVYKHRRRKEKALRKLAGLEQHLVRLSDLVGELRRQLKPLQQQAETAARAAEVAAELREVRLTLRARELAGVRERSASLDAEEAAFAARLAELEQRHDAEEATERRVQSELAELEPQAGRAGEAVHRLATVRERLKGTVALAEARARHLAEALAEEPEGRSVADLEREAAEVADELAAVERELAATTAATADAAAGRDRARDALAAFDQAAARAERARAAVHQREVRLASEVAGLERTIEQMQAEAGRLREQAGGVERRRAETAAQLERLGADRAEIQGQQAAREAERRQADEQRAQRAAEARRLATEERRVEAERAAARARREAFEATARAAGGDALAFLEGAGRDGVLGPLAPALSVDPGYEAAVAAALGPDADAIVVAGPTVATTSARLLHDAGSGRAILLHPSDANPDHAPTDQDAANARSDAQVAPGVGPQAVPAGNALADAGGNAPADAGGDAPSDAREDDPVAPAEARGDAPAVPGVGPRTGRVAEGREMGAALSTGGPVPTAPVTTEVGPMAGNGVPLLLERVATSGFAGEVARGLLAGVLVAEDLERAGELLERHPGARVVTLAGELVAAGRVEGGVVPEASGLAARRAAEQAATEEAAADATLERVGAELRAVQQDLEGQERRAADTARALRDAQAAVRRLDDRATLAGKELRGLEGEAADAAERLHELDAGRERAAARLATAQAELAAIKGPTPRPAADPTAAEDGPAGGLDPSAFKGYGPAGQGVLPGTGAERDAELLAGGRGPLADALDRAEQAATAARVAGAAVGERRRLLDRRLAELRAQAAAEVEAADRRARARAARLDGARRAGLAATAGASALARLERSLATAGAERDRLAEALQAARAGLAAAAAGRRQAAAALDEHHAVTRASDEARVEARLRAEELGKRIVEEFAIDPDEAMAEYLPGEARLAELPDTDPRRQPSNELRRAAAALDRRLTLLGRVNPLALEEFRALEERYGFLSGQLQDLKESRRDLLKVVRAVDERVREVFGTAFEDVAREFQRTFGLLFPGGEGRLVLTEPDDLLESGIEVEARPPGKRVRRLSLLSGGERSLVALAFYFAIFRARPSPFYVLDEVEAALDDVNLHRFLDLLDDAREHAQLLVVSHQRRTMEAADALYGVSMQTEGVSKVVSRRLRSGTLDQDAAVAATR
jgi:chromosome segregation protein